MSGSPAARKPDEITLRVCVCVCVLCLEIELNSQLSCSSCGSLFFVVFLFYSFLRSLKVVHLEAFATLQLVGSACVAFD